MANLWVLPKDGLVEECDVFDAFVLVSLALVALNLLRIEWKLAQWSGKSQSLSSKDEPKAMTTLLEREMLVRMEAAFPELRFHAKVAVGALLETKAGMYARIRSGFSSMMVDAVAQRRDDGSVLGIVCFDGMRQGNSNDALRDATLAKAGYRVVKWNVANPPSAQKMRSELLPNKLLRPMK